MTREEGLKREAEILGQIRERTQKAWEEDPTAEPASSMFTTVPNDSDPYFAEVFRQARLSKFPRILDVGSGYGWLLDYMRRAGIDPIDYVGVEQAQAASAVAKGKLELHPFPERFRFYEALWPHTDGPLAKEVQRPFDLAFLIGLIVETDAADYVDRLIRPALRCAKVVAFETLWKHRYGGRLTAHRAGDIVRALEESPWVKEMTMVSSQFREGVLFMVESSHPNVASMDAGLRRIGT
jgi:SAM-dependent methyltransferase